MQSRNWNNVRPHLEQLEDRLSPTTLTVTPQATAVPSSAPVPSGLTIGAAASAAAQHAAHSHVVVIQ